MKTRVVTSVELPCPIEEAWAVLVAWERQAGWLLDADRVQVVSSAREGVGVRLAVRTRLFGVPAFTEPIEVTGWEPPHRLTIRHGGPVAGEGAWELAAVPGGTRFTWTEEVELAVPVLGGAAGRIYAPLLRVLMRRALAGLRASVIASGPDRR
jgi:uncharacterized protein YndB with AHSA1/START domain